MSYEVPKFFKTKGEGEIDIIYNSRGPFAERDPYKYAEVGYRVCTRNPYKYAYAGYGTKWINRHFARRRHLRIGAEIGGCLLIIAFIILMIVLVCSITVPAKAEDGTIFPSYWEHDAELVKNVQRALNTYGENVTVDGKFGPKTAQAVKRLQKQYGKAVTGVVDDDFAWMFRVENWPYNKGFTLYYMADLASIYARSDYEDLIYISLGGRGYDANNPESTGSHVWLFRDGVLIADSPCITGKYFTPLGVKKVEGRKESETGRYSTYRWLLHINEKIYIHGLLEYYDASRDNQRLGAHQSDGSIRVPTDFAEWLYKNMPRGVTVVIDDRAFSPYNAPGYEHLLEEDSEWGEYADWEEEEEEDWDYDGVG